MTLRKIKLILITDGEQKKEGKIMSHAFSFFNRNNLLIAANQLTGLTSFDTDEVKCLLYVEGDMYRDLLSRYLDDLEIHYGYVNFESQKTTEDTSVMISLQNPAKNLIAFYDSLDGTLLGYLCTKSGKISISFSDSFGTPPIVISSEPTQKLESDFDEILSESNRVIDTSIDRREFLKTGVTAFYNSKNDLIGLAVRNKKSNLTFYCLEGVWLADTTTRVVSSETLSSLYSSFDFLIDC